MSDARVIASDGKWRIVRIEDGDRVTIVLEKQDGHDALGCERWKEINVGSIETISRQMRDWIVGHALTCSHMKETE